MRDPQTRVLCLVVTVALCLLGLTGCTHTLDPVAHQEKDKPSAAAKSTGTKSRVTHRIVRKREKIPSGHQTRRTARLAIGNRRVSRPGRAGLRVTVIRINLKNGKETGRRVVRRVVVRKPVPRITLVGTRVHSPGSTRICDSNYAGRCVPFASDVDCLGGGGNGPAYVAGPVRVVGIDVYGLDADGDGVGCD